MLQQKTIYITAKSKYRNANIICSSTHPCLLACNSANFCLLHSRLLPPPRRASRALTTAKTNRADNQSFILTVRLQLMVRRDHCEYLYCTHWTKFNPITRLLFWGNCLHPDALSKLPDVFECFPSLLCSQFCPLQSADHCLFITADAAVSALTHERKYNFGN